MGHINARPYFHEAAKRQPTATVLCRPKTWQRRRSITSSWSSLNTESTIEQMRCFAESKVRIHNFLNVVKNCENYRLYVQNCIPTCLCRIYRVLLQNILCRRVLPPFARWKTDTIQIWRAWPVERTASFQWIKPLVGSKTNRQVHCDFEEVFDNQRKMLIISEQFASLDLRAPYRVFSRSSLFRVFIFDYPLNHSFTKLFTLDKVKMTEPSELVTPERRPSSSDMNDTLSASSHPVSSDGSLDGYRAPRSPFESMFISAVLDKVGLSQMPGSDLEGELNLNGDWTVIDILLVE